MSTNFYLNDQGKEGQHIGKVNAAGLYCWDCRVTLCKGGPGNIHYGRSDEARTWCPECQRDITTGWFETCPFCGKGPVTDPMLLVDVDTLSPEDMVGKIRSGVRACQSFTWAILPYDFRRLYLLGNGSRNPMSKDIIDEYGRTQTYQDFVDRVLKSCPIQYLFTIGQEFS